ncbi:Uncharacterized protein QTN25_001915 [Entamoeba marina]
MSIPKMIKTKAEAFTVTNCFPQLPKQFKTYGFFRTPYVINCPHKFRPHSIIIYCHSSAESLESSVNSTKIISEVMNVSVVCMEYCGYYSQSQYSEGNLLCQMQDILQMTRQNFNLKDIYIMGNIDGCYPAIELIESCQRQRLDIGRDFIIVIMKHLCILLKKCLKKFKNIINESLSTSDLNLLDSETDSVLTHLSSLLKPSHPNIQPFQPSIIIQKPNAYRDSIDVISDFIPDLELAKILLTFGYYSPDSLATLSQFDIDQFGLNPSQNNILLTAANKAKKYCTESTTALEAIPSLPKCSSAAAITGDVLENGENDSYENDNDNDENDENENDENVNEKENTNKLPLQRHPSLIRLERSTSGFVFSSSIPDLVQFCFDNSGSGGERSDIFKQKQKSIKISYSECCNSSTQ